MAAWIAQLPSASLYQILFLMMVARQQLCTFALCLMAIFSLLSSLALRALWSRIAFVVISVRLGDIIHHLNYLFCCSLGSLCPSLWLLYYRLNFILQYSPISLKWNIYVFPFWFVSFPLNHALSTLPRKGQVTALFPPSRHLCYDWISNRRPPLQQRAC